MLSLDSLFDEDSEVSRIGTGTDRHSIGVSGDAQTIRHEKALQDIRLARLFVGGSPTEVETVFDSPRQKLSRRGRASLPSKLFSSTDDDYDDEVASLVTTEATTSSDASSKRKSFSPEAVEKRKSLLELIDQEHPDSASLPTRDQSPKRARARASLAVSPPSRRASWSVHDELQLATLARRAAHKSIDGSADAAPAAETAPPVKPTPLARSISIAEPVWVSDESGGGELDCAYAAEGGEAAGLEASDDYGYYYEEAQGGGEWLSYGWQGYEWQGGHEWQGGQEWQAQQQMQQQQQQQQQQQWQMQMQMQAHMQMQMQQWQMQQQMAQQMAQQQMAQQQMAQQQMAQQQAQQQQMMAHMAQAQYAPPPRTPPQPQPPAARRGVERGRLLAMATDRKASRQLQDALPGMSDAQVASAVAELGPHLYALSKHASGNYIVSRLASMPRAHEPLQAALTGHVAELLVHPQGSRVVQAAVAELPEAAARALVGEVEGLVRQVGLDTHGSWGICAAYKRTQAPFLLREVVEHVHELALEQHGCRVVQRVLAEAAAAGVGVGGAVGAILSSCDVAALSLQQYGNYAVQVALRHAEPADRSTLIDALLPSLVSLSTSKFGSNVAEAALMNASPAQLDVARALVFGAQADESVLPALMAHPFGNYVVQAVLRRLPAETRAESLALVEARASDANFGRTILAQLAAEGA